MLPTVCLVLHFFQYMYINFFTSDTLFNPQLDKLPKVI